MMKKRNQKWTSTIVAVMLFAFMTACGSGQQEAAEETENMGMAEGMDGMDMARQGNAAAVNTEGEPAFVVAYMDIKNALVNDNFEQVKKEASDLQEALAGSELSEEQRSQLRESAVQLVQAQDIEAQRQAFAQLSRQLYEVVKDKDVTGKPVYWQHCPMAMNGLRISFTSLSQ